VRLGPFFFVFVPSAVLLVAACKRPSPVGLEECDAYVTRYESCIAHMGPELRAKSEPSFQAEVSYLKSAASDPAQKATLTRACRVALSTIGGECP
jgi:hypothetical protein